MHNLFRGRDQQPGSSENIDQQAQQRWRLQRTRAPRRAPQQPEEQLAAAALPSGIPPEGRVVVTISSQYGSGGSEIGRIVANETGLLYLDREIIGQVAARLGINVEQATNLDERTVGAVRHVLDALQSSSFLSLNLAWLLNPSRPPAYSQELVYWYLTRRVILEMASEGNAVIIGRGSQFLLHEAPRTLHTYIFAPLEQRITNVMEHEQVSRQQAERMVAHRDYEHEAYLRRYYNSQQDRPELYHLLINTGLFPFDLAAKLIKETLPLVGAFSGAEEASEPSMPTVALSEGPTGEPGEADDAEEKTGTDES